MSKMRNPNMSAPHTTNASELKDAFQLFAETSRQMETAYRELEGRVAHLNQALHVARSERFRQLQEKERLANRLQRLLAALPAGVLVLDADSRVVESNPAATALLGEPLLGERWGDLYRRVAASGEGHGHELVLKNKRVVTVAFSPLVNEPGQIVLLHDVTETERLKALVNRQQNLAAMGEMAAQLAHQIRTPLASALLYLSHLRRNDLDPERRSSAAEKAHYCLRELEGQINDMLLFAHPGRVEFALVDLAELGESVEKTLEPQLAQRDCRLVRDALQGNLHGSREALLAALTNVVGNALEMGARHIRLSAESVEEKVQIRIEDDGPGVDPAIRDTIFDPFVTARPRGTGLGLAAVRSVVEAHGGTVGLVDRPAPGACFQLTLPRRPQPAALPSGGAFSDTVSHGEEQSLWRCI
ncbi:MAG: sensor histidine kinase FleS [Gammaproteobacteria bacterium]